jgi:hypothetical protein
MVWDPATRPLLTRHTSTACLPTSEEIVIARIWTGATRATDADAYEEYMREVALPGYATVTGNRAVLMLRRARASAHSRSLSSASHNAGVVWHSFPAADGRFAARLAGRRD